MEKTMTEFLEELMPILIEMGDQITAISKKLGIGTVAENSELEKNVDDTVPVVEIGPVHGTADYKFALCGAMGTPSQPFAARMDDPITRVVGEINCPECLRIIEKQGGKRKI